MKKYEIINHEGGYAIYSSEESAFFAGYDFMGSVNWKKLPDEECWLDKDEAEAILADLEAADEPAEPENIIHETGRWHCHDYTIVDKIPDYYQVWNVAGIEGYPDYLPLCIVWPETFSVMTDQLLAIKMPKEDQKILHDCSMRTGAGNLAKCRKLLKRSNLKPSTRELAEKALPLFEKYTA